MERIWEHIWAHKFAFLAYFFVVFTMSYLILFVIDFLPESPTETPTETASVTDDADTTTDAVATTTSMGQGTTTTSDPSEVAPGPSAPLPVTITIDRLDKTIPVKNPTSRTIADLDAALLEGAVRHPDSATLTQEGNVFILGHSSYLPNVLNRNFQAFNGIQELEWGDTITVTSADAEYTYRVEKVYEARAQDVTVPIANTGKRLTLATCNSFGSVDDRYIVEAKRVDQRSL